VDVQQSDRPAALPDNAYRELKPGESTYRWFPLRCTPGGHDPVDRRRPAHERHLRRGGDVRRAQVGQGIEPRSRSRSWRSGSRVPAVDGPKAQLAARRTSTSWHRDDLGDRRRGHRLHEPAIYILNLNDKLSMSNGTLFLQIFLVPFLGAVLGVLFLVPFRRYFVKEMHGSSPPGGHGHQRDPGDRGRGGSVGQVSSHLLVRGRFLYNAVSGVSGSSPRPHHAAARSGTRSRPRQAIFSLGTGAEFLVWG